MFTTGAYQSEFEYRDVKHEAKFAPIPDKYDADYSRVPVHNQRKNGICTAEAVCTLIEKHRGDGIVLSRRFLYVVGKKLVDGNLYEGSSIKTMLHAAYKYGTQPESVVPSDTTMPYEQFVDFDPTPFMDTATKIPGYINVATDPASLRSGVYSYGGVALRYEVGKEWWTNPNGTPSWGADIMPLRPPIELISGHAVVLTNYENNSRFYNQIRNSWGTSWGLDGNGYTFYDLYAPTEAWAISPNQITPPNLPKPQNWRHIFKKDLKFGDKGEEVKALQTALAILGYMDSKYITGNYFAITRQAVFAFQQDAIAKVPFTFTWFEVMALFGNRMGPKTRDALNKIFA